MLGDDPPYLSVGTEVSAKYKGAFCEAKIRKVVRSVKCRVTYKQGLGTATVTDDQIKGTLRVGASVEARHNDKKEFVEATITKIQDCSQYTVVFDDGDITTLRRTALCLKSGRHFAESETLDQLPLTHPEHFGNPVIGGRRGRRSRQTQDDSSDDDDDRGNDSGSGSGGKEGPETEPEIGRVVCVELGDKKKKDNWFPGLVVAPTAQDTVRIRVRDDYLVRSFKDARYYTVPKKEATEFTKDLVNKVENSALKVAVEKALLFLEKNELPPHWDRDSLFGNSVSSGNSDSDGELDTDSSDDEPREEKDHFVAQLYKFMDDRGTPINNCPMIGNEDIDLYRLFRAVYKLGGYNRVTNQNQWKLITRRLSFAMQNTSATHNLVKQAYKKFLHSFEDFYRKLGCTMVNHPRGSMRKPRPGRSLIRDKDRNTPVPIQDKSLIKAEKDEDEKDKKGNSITDEDTKKEKRDIKKEPTIKDEEPQPKVKRKEEPAEESASGQESDVIIDGEAESSSSEKSQKSSARLTPSSVSGKSKTSNTSSVKNKEEATKKKPVEKKKLETKRQDNKKDDKIKEDDSTKTRSKAKEDTAKSSKTNITSDSRETRTPSRDPDKKNISKQRRMTDDELKKRGRKKKDVENEKGKSTEERSVEYAPCYKGLVEVGDRLKVYYGPTHESKVTYEAKVIDKEHEGVDAMYLVHYTGWNTRYDEWIKSSRIAHNFTQAQGRVKRVKTTPRPQTPSSNSSTKSSKTATTPSTSITSFSSGAQSRRRAQSDAPGGPGSSKDSRKEDRESNSATRSMTPSPLISSSLRTKSPATTANSRPTRVTRNADSSSNDLGRRTRRGSGHADTITAEESESEDTDSLDSDASEPETMQMQSRSRIKGGVQEKNRREARRRAESRMKIEETSDGEAEKDVEEPRRGRRLRKTIGKLQEVKSEPESDDEQPKGRDFDLNQIRSELKGFDKAVKLEIASVEPEPEEEKGELPSTQIKQEKTEVENIPEKKVVLEPEKKREVPKIEPSNAVPIKREQIKIEDTPSESTDDIYEFKEPEPFEFEVRNKRDSGGSTSSVEKEKEKDKEKDKTKKRVFDEDVKSPKKRQKTFGTPTTPVQNKPEQKQDSSPTESVDAKKKPRKIFKKSDDTEEVDTEGEDTTTSVRDQVSKFYPANYGGVTVFKRKGAFTNLSRAMEDILINDATATDAACDSPKKKQTKTLSSTTPVKGNEIKPETTTLDTADKKKVRKIVNKAEENDETDEPNKEHNKFFPNYAGAKPVSRKDTYTNKSIIDTDEGDENSLTDNKEKGKKATDDDASKTMKKKQKSFGTPAAKSEVNSTDVADAKKKIVRRVTNKKAGEIEESDESGTDDTEEPTTTRDHAKYFSHYSGPKAKAAAAMVNDNESLQERLNIPKSDNQVSESLKSIPVTTNASVSHNKDDAKNKTTDSTTAGSSSLDIKSTSLNLDKKRVPDSVVSGKSETKQEMKPLDFTPIIPHTLPVPAPISTRLPATASIEEKLSAAAVFRSKLKDIKKDEDLDNTPRKTLKETIKKVETTAAKKVEITAAKKVEITAAKKVETTATKKVETNAAKKAKEKEEKAKHEPEKKKQIIETPIIKKDPLQEIEIRRDPLLEMIKKKEEEVIKATTATVTIPIVTKTYVNLKKDQTIKLEDTWKKAAPTIASVSNMEVSNEISNSDPSKDFVVVRKETIVSKIKSTIDRDSVDSTDSSDSEKRLTIIDTEELPDDKYNESTSDIKIKSTASSSTSGQFSIITRQEQPNVVTKQSELAPSIGTAAIINAITQVKSSRVEEDGENLNSLLCEEEIPGSPTPGLESTDHEHRSSGTQNLTKTDLATGSKMAVAFVAAQMPLSTLPSSTHLTKCTLVTTMSGSITVSQTTSSLVAVSMATQHASVQSVRQTLAQSQVQPQQQQPLPQLQVPSSSQVHPHQQQPHPPQPQPPHQHNEQVPPPIPVAVQRRQSNEAAPVMDNTPPTTPDSLLSNISGSPRDEGTGGSTPSSSEDNSKLNRDSSEAENDSAGKGSGPGFSEDDGSSLVNSELGGNGRATSSSSDRIPKPLSKRSSVVDNENISPKKRKKRKDQDNNPTFGQNIASGKKSPRQSTRNVRQGTGSDSDDTSEGSNPSVNNSTPQTNNTASAAAPVVVANAVSNNMPVSGMNNVGNPDNGLLPSGRPRRYNFLTELDPSLDGNQRISILQQRLTDIRKTYNNVKSELATIERRRKKLKRREREAQKAAKAEMQQACS